MANNIVQYTSADYASIKADLIAYIKAEQPGWTDHLETDFGITLVELFSGIGDMFRFYQNVTANESFPSTARLFESLCRHAEWFGYHPHPAAAAQADATFTKKQTDTSATIPIGARISTSDGGVVFEATEQVVILAGVATGTVGMVHGHHITGQLIGISDGSKNQEFKLLNSGLVMLTEGENAVTVYVDGVEWAEYPSLVWASESNGYRMWIDSDRAAWVRFGDGVWGVIPTTDAQITVDYITGGGEEGNVGMRTLNTLQGSITNIESVSNEAAASGGAEQETLEELRTHMPSVAVTRGRAITKEDYERLLEAFGEIEKINVTHPSGNIVQVYVLPEGGAAPGAPLLASVRTYLADIRMITEDVQVLSPTFINVNVTATVDLYEDSADALDDLITDLRAYLDQGEFARELHIHDIYDFFDPYDEIEHVTVTLLAKDGESGINDITTSAGEVITDGTITLSV